MNTHELYMQRCIDLAKNGLGTTYPNPLVGSVIVYDGKIIGEGWHRKAGEPHAEVNAINSVKDKSLLKKATIYVSLEPCSHFGKTPPCCDLIITHKIPNVVIGTVDPFAKVAGNGIKRLMESGANVTVGILEDACNELNKRFFTFHQKKRPYIILKWAESKDGFIAPIHKNSKRPVWITNTYSRQLVHKWRTEEQAILVGTQTVLDDNPKLNARDFFGNNPIRIAIDNGNKITDDFAIKDDTQETLFLTKNKNNTSKNSIFDSNFLENSLHELYNHNIQAVIIEGGRTTLQSFIDKNLWDEARVFIGNNKLSDGITAPKLSYSPTKSLRFFEDELKLFRRYD
ncbi:bifunctional diaminohydroxyphosphoribosylaminopyrimidine deaminase/5-amino-6-(5-phosphoribosylamino)uracil reductase RibD [Flavobacterium chuncheonense]|uniref:Riboflavin biosynthesis protein RibD n=1 Tax=Flavobacterium chuncheonense TaxID=2026653 RepID=A0ABW5YK69_9FLAO